MRLFIAVRLSDEMRKTLIGTMHELKQAGVKGNFVPADNLHMTLCFIGEVKSAEPVKAVMDRLPAEKCRISLDGLGSFGDLLWVGVRSGQKLKSYVKELGAELTAAGIPCDRKKFVPHITVIRKVSGSRPGNPAVPKTEMMVSRISLMKAEQKNGRMVYTEIYSTAAK